MKCYEIIDEYNYDYPKILIEVVDKLIQKENIENAIFSIIFVSNEKIKEINKEYRKIDKPTDVISFALEDNGMLPNSNIRVLGDIFISVDKMKEQAKEYNHSEEREVSFLVVHGIYHLLGYDHMNKEDEEEMFKKQEEVLNEFEQLKRKK